MDSGAVCASGAFPVFPAVPALPSLPLAFARSAALICSQFFSTAAESFAFVSPKTCGWRRTIFEWMDSITSEIVNAPVSSARSEWNVICRSKSPNSDANSRGSLDSIASRTSYVSSIRNLRSDACVCSRSQGQPFGARRRACSATSFANHSPASLSRRFSWMRGEVVRRGRGRFASLRGVRFFMSDITIYSEDGFETRTRAPHGGQFPVSGYLNPNLRQRDYTGVAPSDGVDVR